MPVYMGPYWQSLPVTRNCWQALRRLRTHGDRLLWVDAICINQQDVLERGHQVPLMRQIYTEASRVVAYLGEKGEDDPKLNLLRTSRRDFDAENRKLLMNKPYFHRLWIIQELKLAYKAVVVHGNDSIHCNILKHYLDYPLWKEDGFQDLLSTLDQSTESNCADPRDKIYGLLGIVEPEEAAQVPADYSISVQHTFAGLASWFLKNGQMGLRNYFGAAKRLPNLPSWAPDWTCLTTRARPAAIKIGFVSERSDSESLPARSWHFSRGMYNAESQELKICSDMSLLSMAAYSLFKISKECVLLSCLPQDPLLIVEDFHIQNLSTLDDLDTSIELECFCIPTLDDLLLLRKHGEGVYSVQQSCRIRSQAELQKRPPGEKPRQLYPHELYHFGYPRRSWGSSQSRKSALFCKVDQDVWDHWVTATFYSNTSLMSGTKTALKQAKHAPVNTRPPDDQDELLYHPVSQFQTVRALWEETAGLLPDASLKALRTKLPANLHSTEVGRANISRDLRSVKPHLVWLELLAVSRRDELEMELDENLAKLELQPPLEESIASCRSIVKLCRIFLDRVDLMACLEDLEGSHYDPVINRPRVPVAVLIYAAWNALLSMEPDTNQSLSWNHTLIVMYKETATLLHEFLVSLRRRQILRRMGESEKQGPQRIILI